MANEYSELVNGTIERAMKDYINSVRRVAYLSKQKDELIATNEHFRERKEGESLRNYRRTKQRNTVDFVSKQIEDAEKLRDSCKNFFTSDWMQTISELSGQMILDVMNKKLKQEGYEV